MINVLGVELSDAEYVFFVITMASAGALAVCAIVLILQSIGVI